MGMNRRPAPDESPTPHRSRKDRRNNCRGKPGVAHVWMWVVPGNAWHRCRPIGPWKHHRTRTWHGPWWSCAHQWVCVTCGKQDGTRDDPPPCPDNTGGLSRLGPYWWQTTPAVPEPTTKGVNR